VFAIYGRGDQRKMDVRKMRDGPANIAIPFALRTKTLGHDRDGEPVMSCTVEWGEPGEVMEEKPKARSADTVFQQALDKFGNLPAPLAPIREFFMENYPAEDDGAKRTALSPLLKRLSARPR
jgi:hypothetical protein